VDPLPSPVAVVATWHPSHAKNEKLNHRFSSSRGVVVILVPLTPQVRVLRFVFLPLKPNPRIPGPLPLLLAKSAKRMVTLPNIVGTGVINQHFYLLMPISLKYPSLIMR